jgi:hypothetical protein
MNNIDEIYIARTVLSLIEKQDIIIRQYYLYFKYI